MSREQRRRDCRIDLHWLLGEHQRIVAVDTDGAHDALRSSRNDERSRPSSRTSHSRSTRDARTMRASDVSEEFRCNSRRLIPADVQRDDELAIDDAALRGHDGACASGQSEPRRVRRAPLCDTIGITGQHRASKGVFTESLRCLFDAGCGGDA